MPPMNGSDVVLLAEDAPGSGNHIVIGHQRDLSINENSETVDYNSKESRAQSVGYGRYSSDMSLDALYVPSDVAMAALKQAIRQGLYITVQTQIGGVATEEAECVVTGNVANYPDQGAVTVAVSLVVNGEWTTL